MRLGVLFLGGWVIACAQNCVPTGILPGTPVTAALDSSACVLTDGTLYLPYRLTLPVRGQLQLSMTPADGSIVAIIRDASGAQVASGAAIQQSVEAGTYTIAVNGQGGAFTLTSAFAAEPGMWCTEFPNLGLNQTVSGSLGSSGCTAPDGTPYEAYQVNTFGAGALSVSVSSPNLNALVTVRDADGNVLATGANSVSAALAAGSQYEVVVSQMDNPGAYQLSTTFQAAAGETCVVQKSFTNPGSDAAAVTASSCSLTIDGSGDLQFYNYYSVTTASAGVLHISASTRDFHPTLYLLDGGGNQLALDSEGAGAGKSDIQMQVPAGTCLVQLLSDAASGGGNYTFAYDFAAGNPQPCQTTALSLPPSPASGALSAASCRTAWGLADIYSITLPSAGLLGADLATAAFPGQVAIRDAKDNLLAFNQDVEGLGDSNVSAVLPAGTYSIVASASSGSGAYQLTPAFTAQAVAACAKIGSLDANHASIQNLGASGCFAGNGQPADYYRFTLDSDGVVAAVMTSTTVAGYLSLTDANGNVLRSDTGSYSYNDPLIVQFLKAGSYQLIARAAAAGESGLYQLSLLDTPGPRPAFCAPLAPLAPGTVSGTLQYTSCQYVDNTFADVYPIALANAAAVDLKLTTGDFDPYLVLLDAKGNTLAQADDGGGGTTAHIAQQLAAGSYFVVAKPFSGYDSVGNYQLTFQQQ
jgi:hypothetical protein